MTASDTAKPSIRDLPPLERGGEEARIGMDLQDHVAARHLIDLLEQPSLLEVWCETHDDITLFWQGTQCVEVEFVQVKGKALDQLWSVAKLCERDRKEKQAVAGSSIYERSLANDRCREPCRFRLVTCLPPKGDLDFLQLPFDAPDRKAKSAQLDALACDIDGKADKYVSPNGNGAQFWLLRLLWEVFQSAQSVATDNQMRLLRFVTGKGIILFPDQVGELYASLLAKARDAALSKWGTDPTKKKICKPCMKEWLDGRLEARRHPPATGGTRLKDKLRRAGIGDGDLTASMESRQRYMAERYQPKYLSSSDLNHIEDEVSAILLSLRAKLDAGELPDDGVAFHAACLKALEGLQAAHVGTKPPLSVLQGCMYNIADRCVHRFTRASA